MSQAYYRKWRPRLWEQVVSQEHIVQTLKNAISSGRVGHAYLFAGPRGTGKTTTARLLAKAVNCLAEDPNNRPCDQCIHCQAVTEGRFLDLIEIDAASNTSVEDIRDLRDKINFSPTQGKYKVYIIDEVHMLSTAAFNALLKTLEEPPPHAIFILATTEVHKIPATVLSRCQRHEFRRIPVSDIVRHLKDMISKEGLSFDDDALVLIARQSTGSIRDAISLVDQLASSGGKVTLEMAQNILGTATNQVVVNLVDTIIDRKAASGFDCIHNALDSGTDPRQFSRQVVDYLRQLLLFRVGNADQVDVTQELRAQMAQQAQSLTIPQLLEAIKLFNNAASDRSTGWHPGLLLELALAEILEEKPQSLATADGVNSHKFATETTPSANLAGSLKTVTAKPVSAVLETVPVSVPPLAPVVSTGPLTASQPSSALPEIPGKEAAASVTPGVSAVSASSLTPGSQAVTYQEFLQNWKKICTAVKNRNAPQTLGLLNSCKPLNYKDGLLVLGFASEVLQSKMETGKHIEVTRQVLAAVLGVTVNISCTVIGGKANARLADAEEESDGIVNEALNLGGKIKHKRKENG
jgi:DNA polymerase III subunit gamma/tau